MNTAVLLTGLGLLAGSAALAQRPTAVATFAGGCFWCVEADFDKVPGVISTTSGYIGGTLANPTYAQVSAGTTGHAEAVQIVFDPAQVSDPQLLQKLHHAVDRVVTVDLIDSTFGIKVLGESWNPICLVRPIEFDLNRFIPIDVVRLHK